MNSAIYEGTVQHRRFQPVPHEFSYRLFMMYLDLDELGDVLARSPFWSDRRWAPARFRRADYLGDPHAPLADAVRDEAARRLGHRPEGPVRMLTHLRYWGYCFNPVTFYYCFAPGGERLEAIVAEITNTPWNERHRYVLDPAESEAAQAAEHTAEQTAAHEAPQAARHETAEAARHETAETARYETAEAAAHEGPEAAERRPEHETKGPPGTERAQLAGFRWTFPKAFHVSPFLGMGLRYDWRFTLPADRLGVHMRNLQDAETVFDATLLLNRTEMTSQNLHRVLLRYPAMTLKVITAIHTQAARLYLKRVPFHPHPAKQTHPAKPAHPANQTHPARPAHPANQTHPAKPAHPAVQTHHTQRRRPSPWEALARRLVLGVLRQIEDGELTLRDHTGTHRFGRCSPASPLRATLTVHDPAFYPAAAFEGSIGAGETYARGDWSADDLTALIRILSRNQTAAESLRGRLITVWQRGLHALRRNTRAGSRRNIQAHYDLSDAFFALFLDETLTYSCGIFPTPEASLKDASEEKLDRICRRLELRPEHHVLEIGTGWGSFALHAAGRYGCRVTTTTISRNQYERARARVAAAGLQDLVTVEQRDYRDLTGVYDRLVSIEMIEAVGAQYYDTYFGVCAGRLRPGGAMMLQAITIRDELFERARRTPDFIKHVIFPGSCIPSVAAMRASIARATELQVAEIHDITEHYAPTLEAWRRNLLARADEARQLGFDDVFQRLYEFYFCYCAGGFEERRIGDVQMLLVKPGARFCGA